MGARGAGVGLGLAGGAQYCHRNADPELPGVCAAGDDGQVNYPYDAFGLIWFQK